MDRIDKSSGKQMTFIMLYALYKVSFAARVFLYSHAKIVHIFAFIVFQFVVSVDDSCSYLFDAKTVS